MLYVYKITSMKVLTACLYSSGRISTLSTSFVSGVSACAKEKIAFAACAGHLIEIVRLSEAEGSSDVSFGCSSDTGTSSELLYFFKFFLFRHELHEFRISCYPVALVCLEKVSFPSAAFRSTRLTSKFVTPQITLSA